MTFCNFRLNNGFRFAECRKQTRLPIAEKNARKCHFIRSHVTKYSKYFAGFDHECLRPACHFENGKHPGYELGSRSASLKAGSFKMGVTYFTVNQPGFSGVNQVTSSCHSTNLMTKSMYTPPLNTSVVEWDPFFCLGIWMVFQNDTWSVSALPRWTDL